MTEQRTWGDHTIIDVVSGCEEEAVARYMKEQPHALSLNTLHGYTGHSLEPLIRSLEAARVALTGLVIVVSQNFDLAGIERLEALRILAITGPSWQPRLEAFPALEEVYLRFEGTRLPSLPNLHTANLGGLKATDLRAFSDTPALRSLELIGPSLTSLDGIGDLRELERLCMYRAQKLRALGGISESRSLRILEVELCKTIEDLQGFASSSLVDLRLTRCGSVPSLGFLGNLPNLRSFSFVGTNVLDGKMMGLAKLDYAGFDDKKHYTHKFEQIEALQRARRD